MKAFFFLHYLVIIEIIIDFFCIIRKFRSVRGILLVRKTVLFFQKRDGRISEINRLIFRYVINPEIIVSSGNTHIKGANNKFIAKYYVDQFYVTMIENFQNARFRTFWNALIFHFLNVAVLNIFTAFYWIILRFRNQSIVAIECQHLHCIKKDLFIFQIISKGLPCLRNYRFHRTATAE